MCSRKSVGAAALFLLVLPAAASTVPEVDALATAPKARRALVLPAADLTRPGSVVHMEERLGVPTFLQPARAGEKGRHVLAQAHVNAEGAARAHLLDLAPQWGLREEDVLAAPLRHVHDVGSGPIIVQLGQESFGIPVFRDEIRIAMTRSFEPIAVSGYIPAVAGIAEPVFSLGAPEALARAAEGLGIVGITQAEVESLGSAPGGYETLALVAPRRASVATPVRAKKVLFHLPERLEAAWYLEIDVPADGSSTLYACVVSAANGALLYRHRLVAEDGFVYRVFADSSGLNLPWNGPQGRAGDPYPGTTPDRWQAPFLPPNVIALESGPISTRDPWLPENAAETRGNNVDAYADLVAPDGFSAGDFRADVTGSGIFDRTYDVSKNPDASADQRKAAITQLFYVTNFLHDWYYDVGFNEAAGNAQALNFGRGGIEGDSLRAEAQDYSGRDNANMTTPADGGRPRMQMYTFSPAVRRGIAVVSPPGVTFALSVGLAKFGPSEFSVTAPVARPDDGVVPSTDACEPLVNGAAIAGKIALVEDGACFYSVKVANAQAAGAVGVIVVSLQDQVFDGMPDQAGTTLPYTIPAFIVSRFWSFYLDSWLNNGLAVTMSRDAPPARDGSLDSHIVAHEWGHYLTNRLIGNANGLGPTQAGGLGEGWGDFSSLLLTVQADAGSPDRERYAGIYPVGGYAKGGGENGLRDNTGWYFGFRRYPYSTDMKKNPLTYRHIMNGVNLPNSDTAPINGPTDGSWNSEVHNTGEIWATMLWECYAALLRDARLTFQEARDRMRAYLVASLKLTPVNPTLLEARDALLAAAWARDPDDHALFVRAFAKRGAGPRAVAGDRFDPDNAGTVESFEVGGDIGVVSMSLDDSAGPCDEDGRLDAGETGRLTFRLKNRGLFRLSATQLTVRSTDGDVSFPSGSTTDVPATDPTQSTTVLLPVKLSPGAHGMRTAAFDVTLRDPSLFSDATASATFRVNFDVLAASSRTDDVETPTTAWASAATSSAKGAIFERREIAPFSHLWSSRITSGFAGPGDVTLTSPPLVVSFSEPFGFSFLHRYSFLWVSDPPKYLDGGVLELSTDDGTTWTDIGKSAYPGYGDFVLYGSPPWTYNPLKGRPAWAGTCEGFPAFTPVTVSLGTLYAGRTVRVRFRRGFDAADDLTTWEIDDFAFTGITNTPFPSMVADPGHCGGRVRPVGRPGGGTVVRRN